MLEMNLEHHSEMYASAVKRLKLAKACIEELITQLPEKWEDIPVEMVSECDGYSEFLRKYNARVSAIQRILSCSIEDIETADAMAPRYAE